MAVALALYYGGWLRFFAGGRAYALYFASMLGLPIPMAIAPIVYFLAAGALLRSPLLAAAAFVLAVGHIPITAGEKRRLERLAADDPAS